MKIIIKNEICCNYENLGKYLLTRYVKLVNKSYYDKVVNMVAFPIDNSTITSSDIIKAEKKIVNKEIQTFYFARCFTIEATQLINENNGMAFYLIDFPWFDESYNSIRGGKIKKSD